MGTDSNRPIVDDNTDADHAFSNVTINWVHVGRELAGYAYDRLDKECTTCNSCGESIGKDAVYEVIDDNIACMAAQLIGQAIRKSNGRTLDRLGIEAKGSSSTSASGGISVVFKHQCGATSWSLPEGTPPNAVAWSATCDGCGEERRISRDAA